MHLSFFQGSVLYNVSIKAGKPFSIDNDTGGYLTATRKGLETFKCNNAVCTKYYGLILKLMQKTKPKYQSRNNFPVSSEENVLLPMVI
jgi:hypothetical protein